MSDDNEYGRVPAGWYPDPLGLPQLRWWDNHAWTDRVSDARQPMMTGQPVAPTVYADDEFPSRRSRRTSDAAAADTPPREQPTASVLRQLAPPSDDDTPSAPASVDLSAPASVDLSAPVNAPVATPASTRPAVARTDSTMPASASAAAEASLGASSTPVSAGDPRRRGTHQSIGITATHLQSVEVWAIALLPMLQLLLSLLVLASVTTGPSVVFMALIWLAPYPVTLVLALLDNRSLRHRGIDNPASWLWALGSGLPYLMARAVRLSRVSGAGFGPLAVFLLLIGLIVGSILAVPGLVISALPNLFATEASNSAELAARSIGGSIEVTCPPELPLFIGQQVRCPTLDANGDDIVVTVSLQRSNGWITWQVDDWGVFSIVR